jgi:hypothetical protein
MSESIYEMEHIQTQKINGIVNRIEQSNHGIMAVNFTLNGHVNTPVSIEFDYAKDDTPSPIKIGDWLEVEIKITRSRSQIYSNQ